MANQATVAANSSELSLEEEDASRKGIKSGSGYKASNFSGGDIGEDGNIISAQAQYIRGGYAPTTSESRLSTVSADTEAKTDTGITATQEPEPIALPAPVVQQAPTTTQAPASVVPQAAPVLEQAPLLGSGPGFEGPGGGSSGWQAPTIGQPIGNTGGYNPSTDPANSLDASAYGNAVGVIGGGSSIEGAYGQGNQSSEPGVHGQSFSDNADYGDPAQIGYGADGYGTAEGGGGGGEGGTVLCTYFNAKGMIPDEVYAADQAYGESVDPAIWLGYYVWAHRVVRWLAAKPRAVEPAIFFIVNGWARQMAYLAGVEQKPNRLGQFLMAVGVPACGLLGRALLAARRRPAH